MHVSRNRGSAKDHACVDCGQSAREWSQIHGTDGLSVEHFEPRCKKCHAAYDGTPQGEAHGSAKLTEADVRNIRKSPLPEQQLAKTHNVAASTINDVRNFKTWKHVQ